MTSKWGIDPERDICSLGVMVQGSGQMGELSARRRRRRRRRRRHLEIGVWNSFNFWPESVSYERSRLIRRCILREISARVFFGKNQKDQEKSDFQYFQDIRKMEKLICNISRIWELRKNTFSNISSIIENVEDSNFQYFQDRNK